MLCCTNNVQANNTLIQCLFQYLIQKLGQVLQIYCDLTITKFQQTYYYFLFYSKDNDIYTRRRQKPKAKNFILKHVTSFFYTVQVGLFSKHIESCFIQQSLDTRFPTFIALQFRKWNCEVFSWGYPEVYSSTRC